MLGLLSSMSVCRIYRQGMCLPYSFLSFAVRRWRIVGERCLGLGSFQLGTMVDAFDNASMEETEIDLLLNNCAVFPLTFYDILLLMLLVGTSLLLWPVSCLRSDSIDELSKSGVRVEDFVSVYCTSTTTSRQSNELLLRMDLRFNK